MTKLRKATKRVLCLLLAIILLVPLMAGCQDEVMERLESRKQNASDKNEDTADIESQIGSVEQKEAFLVMLEQYYSWLIFGKNTRNSPTTYAGSTFPTGYNIRQNDQFIISSGEAVQCIAVQGQNARIVMRNAMCGTFTAYPGYQNTRLELEGESGIGLFQTKSPITVTNPKGSILNADIWPGGEGTTFTNMPEMLILRPGTWAIVDGKRYDNTKGTEDMVLYASKDAEEAWGTLRIALPKKVTLRVGETVHVEPSITPLTASKQGSFETSNYLIAEVNNVSAILYTVTGMRPGTCTLTYTHKASGKQASCAIEVLPADAKPTPAPEPEGEVTLGHELYDGAVGKPYYGVLTVDGGNGKHYYDAQGLPKGISINKDRSTATRIFFEGIPEEGGHFKVMVRVRRNSDNAVLCSKEYSLYVVPAPKIITDSLLAGIAGHPYTQTLYVEGIGRYTFASNNLPTGLSIDNNGTISGTPAAAGSYSFDVKVTDMNNMSSNKKITLVIAPGISISSNLPASVQKNDSGANYSLSAADGTAPYTFEVVSGALPTGITLPTEGSPIFGGTFTKTGTYTFAVKATDSKGITVTKQFTVTVETDLALGDGSTLALSDGTVGDGSYADGIHAMNGAPPYTYAVTDGALPPGLSMNADGSITGMPTTAGTYTFTVTVTDGDGDKKTAQCSILIN